MLIRDDSRLKLEEQQVSKQVSQEHQERGGLLAIMDRANRIAGHQDLVGMIQEMLDLMIEITSADSGNFFQLDQETDELVIKCVRGENASQHLVGLRINRKVGVPGLSINGKQPVVIGDLPSDQQWLRAVDPESAARQRNVINLPIVNQDSILGIIQIFNYQQADLDLLMVLGNRLASEIRNRVEVAKTKRSVDRLWTLVDVLGEAAGTLDHNRLLHLVTENASRLVDAERTSVFLVDPETDEMIVQVAYQSSEKDDPTLKGPEQENASPYTKQNPVIKGNRSNSPTKKAFQQSGDFSFFNRSAITVPIKSEPLIQGHAVDYKHVLGGLMALNKHNASFEEEDAQLIHVLASQTSTFLQVAEMYESAGELFLGIIKALAAAIDAKDPYTQGHSQRVSDYSVLISRELGLNETTVNDIRIGSLLHDIGKIGIPDSILMKEGELTSEEFATMKSHPNTGGNILRQVNLLEPMIPAIAEHHERLDGSGYPYRITGREISLVGRIVAVADVFDAMTSHRPYRPSLTVPDVLVYLQENAGKLFDKECVQALNVILSKSNHSEFA
jgi:putative nucleotidyltransferase with HDIG domain